MSKHAFTLTDEDGNHATIEIDVTHADLTLKWEHDNYPFASLTAQDGSLHHQLHDPNQRMPHSPPTFVALLDPPEEEDE